VGLCRIILKYFKKEQKYLITTITFESAFYPMKPFHIRHFNGDGIFMADIKFYIIV